MNDIEPYVNNVSYTQTSMNQVNSEASKIYEATIQEKILLSDDGWGDEEMVYKLDNGTTLLFRWYCDPSFSVGQKITWTQDWSGIYISHGNQSIHLQGPPDGNWFECR